MSLKPNEWLTNSEFLDKVTFHNKYYFQSLCLYVDNYRKNIPIPVIVTWDNQFNQLYFLIGKDKIHLEIDVDIAYEDYITLVDRKLRKFFPNYEVEVKKEIPLSIEEMVQKTKNEKINLNDLLGETKQIVEKEIGVIEKVFFKQDNFILNINGKRYLRLSGKIDDPLPISEFLTMLKSIKNNEDKRNFIMNKSREVKEITREKESIDINYTGFQMKNFIEINFQDLQDYDFIKLDTRKWRWGKYILKFETNILENDMLNYLKNNKVEIKEK